MPAALKISRSAIKQVGKKCSAGSLSKKATGRIKILTGNDLIADMQSFGRTVTATPKKARGALVKLGVLTSSGKSKTLIRG